MAQKKYSQAIDKARRQAYFNPDKKWHVVQFEKKFKVVDESFFKDNPSVLSLYVVTPYDVLM